MKKFFKEFKEFISRGNVMDMAIGIVIGSAFTAIVTSLVNGIIMPCIGQLIAGVNFEELKVILTPATEEAPEVAILYGAFIQTIINFIIIAFVVFCVVKGINKLKRKKEEPAPEPEKEPEPDPQTVLLTEIRDLLKK